VFVKGQRIGGNDEFLSANATGELRRLVGGAAAAAAAAAPPVAETKPAASAKSEQPPPKSATDWTKYYAEKYGL
jgi:hypothetical protein